MKDGGWNVYFDGNFWSREGRDRAVREIALNTEFFWGGRFWRVPSLYLCAQGVVLDFCMQVDREEVRAFLERWEELESAGGAPDQAKRRALFAGNPLEFALDAQLSLEGCVLRRANGCGVAYLPFPVKGERRDREAERLVSHYRLDPEQAWRISRMAFLWDGARTAGGEKAREDPERFALTMRREPEAVPGTCFSVSGAGEQIALSDAAGRPRGTLTVLSCEEEELPPEMRKADGLEFPPYFTALRYTLYPQADPEAFALEDAEEGDRPVRKAADGSVHVAGAASIGIIGGACGPAAPHAQGSVRTAFSKPRFLREGKRTWQAVFYEKRTEDKTVFLSASADAGELLPGQLG